MSNKYGDGKNITVTCPSGGCVSGLGLLIGSLFGIPVTTQAAGDLVALEVEGEFPHIKEGAGSGQAWSVGDSIYWDATNKRLTKTTTSNTKVGYATAAALTTDTTGRFRLVPFVI